jgi:hypothetical protein
MQIPHVGEGCLGAGARRRPALHFHLGSAAGLFIIFIIYSIVVGSKKTQKQIIYLRLATTDDSRKSPLGNLLAPLSLFYNRKTNTQHNTTQHSV